MVVSYGMAAAEQAVVSYLSQRVEVEVISSCYSANKLPRARVHVPICVEHSILVGDCLKQEKTRSF